MVDADGATKHGPDYTRDVEQADATLEQRTNGDGLLAADGAQLGAEHLDMFEQRPEPLAVGRRQPHGGSGRRTCQRRL